MNILLTQLINGLHVGSVYALIALGYTMVYGIVKLINFAHGDIIMVGAYAALMLLTSTALPFGIAAMLSVLFCVTLGVLVERIAYKPLRNSPRISSLITTIGVSFFLQNSVQMIFSPTPRPFPIRLSVPTIVIGSLKISGLTFVTILVAVLLMIALELFVRRTRMGKAMRAVSEDMQAAQLMGININTTISMTFAIGAALAAVGAILYSTAYPSVSPTMGALPGLKAFIAAVLGGIGLMPGAMLGGFIMGVAESLTKGYISTQLSDAVVFGILIIVLLVKPSGILGKHVSEKV
ncbi:MAG: branched-chain amino acid ABC transporter permease [Oscillospiraceae bacterium]|jgi:branched-chain amino acid transport system permease protein|nr:branched-chain amino acid ABC transporter permease [Oscillospiraceae bacterium]